MLLVSLLLAGCGARPSASVSATKSVDSYVSLGGRIKTCWFNRMAPLLPVHVYRADVSSDGSQVKISIHERRPLGRAGRVAYVIDFQQGGSRTVVATNNRRMPPHLAAKMEFDIDRWKRGESNCSKEMPTTASIPAAKPAAAR